MTAINRWPITELDVPISKFTEDFGQKIQPGLQTLNGQRTAVDHIYKNNGIIPSALKPNPTSGRIVQDVDSNMAPYTGLGKRRRFATDVGSKAIREKALDANAGKSMSPISSLTNSSSAPMLPFDNITNTNSVTSNGFTAGEMPQVKHSEQRLAMVDNRFIKSNLSSPRGLPNASPAALSSGASEHLLTSSPKSIDGRRIRGSKRLVGKMPKPHSSIPQALSWAEYARQCSFAAYTSRLNPFTLSLNEDRLLRAHIDPVQVTTYLNIRNGILRLWTRNPLVPVTADEALGCAKQARHFGLASVAYQWLTRNGYVNYGCIEVPETLGVTHRMKLKASRRRQVVIVGAGMSGLGCARQLEGLFTQLGDYWSKKGEQPPKIVVLEARRRLGGRVYSHPLRTQVKDSLPGDLRNTAELGAHIITGFEFGNPLNAIIRGQLALRYHGLRDNSVLFDCDGSVVDKERDDSIQKLYNDVLERVCAYRHKTIPTKTLEGDRDLMLFGRDPSGSTHEKNVQGPNASIDAAKVASHDQMAQRNKSTQHVPGGLEKLAGKVYQVSATGAKSSATDAAKAMGWMAKEGIAGNQSLELDSFVKSSTHPTLGATMDEAIKQYQSIINLTPQDMRLLNWHHANLEYSNAAHVNELSLSGWDQDTGNEFEGEHSQIIGGYIQVPKALYHLPYTLDVRFGVDVTGISYEPNVRVESLAKVMCGNGDILEADHVVLTTPLGVIKGGDLKFSPPLPEWKTGAIGRLGFGLLNKVILISCFHIHTNNDRLQN